MSPDYEHIQVHFITLLISIRTNVTILFIILLLQNMVRFKLVTKSKNRTSGTAWDTEEEIMESDDNVFFIPMVYKLVEHGQGTSTDKIYSFIYL